jgi:hypothetical protein
MSAAAWPATFRPVWEATACQIAPIPQRTQSTMPRTSLMPNFDHVLGTRSRGSPLTFSCGFARMTMVARTTGRTTISYLVRCALPTGRSITKLDRGQHRGSDPAFRSRARRHISR